MRPISRKKLEADLTEKVYARYKEVPSYWANLISDYLALWDTSKLLMADIKENGVRVPYSGGMKKNDSVSELTKVQSEMRRILDCLEVRPDCAVENDGPEGI